MSVDLPGRVEIAVARYRPVWVVRGGKRERELEI
jgi:hypothetical protein